MKPAKNQQKREERAMSKVIATWKRINGFGYGGFGGDDDVYCGE